MLCELCSERGVCCVNFVVIGVIGVCVACTDRGRLVLSVRSIYAEISVGREP